MEHLPEFSPAFVADFPGFVVVLVVFWNIFRKFIAFCVFFRIAVKMCYFLQNFMGGGVRILVYYRQGTSSIAVLHSACELCVLRTSLAHR